MMMNNMCHANFRCQQKYPSDQQGVTDVNIRMYFGARKKRFQSNFWYSVSSGGPFDFFAFFFCSASIMPDISMSLSFLRNHIAGARYVDGPVQRESIFLASQGTKNGGWEWSESQFGGRNGARGAGEFVSGGSASSFLECVEERKSGQTGNSWGREGGVGVGGRRGERGVGWRGVMLVVVVVARRRIGEKDHVSRARA